MLRNIETRLTQLQDRTEVTPYHADASCLQQQFSTPLANIIPNIFGTQTHSDDIKLSRDFGSVRFFEKIQYWVIKSKNGFCVSLLNRLIQGRVRLGSIRNKNNWNNASKRLFGSYSHSRIPGFHSGYSAPREQNSRNIFRKYILIPEYSQTNAPQDHSDHGAPQELKTHVLCSRILRFL